MKAVRCAIYTRKSSEEGLEQGFNSLDAQREACAAYVLSQASEGWTLLPGIYDDGGISGGTLERPALQRLLADVAAGQIDIIVVYKVDRLTRSLLDFAKLVEAFDQAGTSFVSITQSFNTTTSMGRLTLNMLLSFAQFEREVTAERIRDKIAASKAKGMWMGGTPPLGYRPDGRSLAVVPEHADLVRQIFARYLDLGNVRLLAEELAAQGVTTPVRARANGTAFGGVRFSRGQLYKLLANPIYIGAIAHRDRTFAGQHAAIIDRATWDRVQAMLAGHVRGDRTVRRTKASPLAGRIVDGEGQPLIASHACKGKVRYRYYVSRPSDVAIAAASPTLRLPAGEIEQLVRQEIVRLLEDPLDLAGRLGASLHAETIAQLHDRAQALAHRLRSRDHEALRALVQQVAVHADRVELTVAGSALCQSLQLLPPENPYDPVSTMAVRLTRTGRALQLVEANGAPMTAAGPDSTPVRLLARARRWWRLLAAGDLTITRLAAREQVSPAYITRVVRLAFLAPDVVEAILDGEMRAGVDGTTLLASDAIAPAWHDQRRAMLPR